MTTSPPAPSAPQVREGLLSSRYAATTAGMFALVFFSAFEALAVTTVMPGVARELDGVRLYALSFAAPLASGVVGMVLTGWWSDRRGPGTPLLASIGAFTVGLVVCGLAPTMPVLVAGRLLQGLGGGGLTVGLYVVVGVVFPTALQPALFASFAAAWVLPSLVGPSAAAWVAGLVGWRWVFLGVVALVGLATVLVLPAVRALPPPTEPDPARPGDPGGRRLGWAVVAAVAVLALDLVGQRALALSVLAGVLVLVAVRPLVPPRTLRAAPGLPSVILARGMLSAGFFSAEAYLPFVLQEQWAWSPTSAGAALAAAGLSWTLASHVQARLRDRWTDQRAILVGAAGLTLGVAGAFAAVALDAPAAALVSSYGLSAAGMGIGYPRTSVATLSASDDRDRGFNSSALSVADSLGGALALAVSGVLFATEASFSAVYAGAVGWALLAVVAATRARPLPAAA
ncbi:MFS transporter [Nocardioides sp.]|uniref:MFS transporter n=1 Tax=Nocardioides sp. TaxID=35761 RepID=UPI003528C788